MPQTARKKTKFVGVYSRESSSRRFEGKPDVCYEITYKVTEAGKIRKVWEKIGWKSEGCSAAYASGVRGDRLQGVRRGESTAPVRDEATLDAAWEEYKKRHLGGKASDTDVSRYDRHLAPRFGRKRLSRITAADLDLMTAELLASGLSPQTVRHCQSLLCRIHNKALKWGMTRAANPTTAAGRVQVNNKRWRWLTREEADALLQEVRRRSRLWHVVSLLSLHTGMRFGEIAALTWDRVDLDSGHVRVTDPKNGQDRTTHLTPTAARTLREWGVGPAGELVFKSRHGGPLTGVSDTFARSVEALGFNAGVTDRRGQVVFHTLRHTFASWLAKAGEEMYVIAELMGHSALEMSRRYMHLCPKRTRSAVASIEREFNHGSLSSGTPEILPGPPPDK